MGGGFAFSSAPAASAVLHRSLDGFVQGLRTE